MVFTQIKYPQKQGLQDQNKGITNCAEFNLQWRNYPIWWYPIGTVTIRHRLNMELDLQRIFGLLCTAVLIGWDPATFPPPPPRIWAHIRGVLLVSLDRRHLFVTLYYVGTSERAEVASSRMARAGSWCNRRIKARRCCSPGDSISYLTIKGQQLKNFNVYTRWMFFLGGLRASTDQHTLALNQSWEKSINR